ncbi:ECF-type sigma factor [Ahniella affigens]|nr:ECF-type sigma factor [Ahniella affigens]
MSDAADASLPLDVATLYQELKRLAHAERRRGHAVTLNTTALVHDLYLDLAARNTLQFESRRQFYAYAAKAMRHLLIDQARNRARLKAGGEWQRADWEDLPFDLATAPLQDALELDSALQALSREDPRAADVVELHVFAGLSIEQIAELLNVSTRTVDRDWRFARAFLKTDCGD